MKKRLRQILIAILILIIVIDGVFLVKWIIDLNKGNEQNQTVHDIVDTNSDDSDRYKMSKQGLEALKEQYPNVLAYIEFEDSFISEPIVQGEDNDYYLRRWIDGTYNSEGSVYFDYSCNKENQNITIYGHNVFYDSSARFSGLEQLEKQEGYDEHHTFKIWYEDEVRTYVIAYVTEYDVNEDSSFDYKVKNFYMQSIYDDYMEWLDNHQQIEPVEESKISKTDNIVTLQTCVKWNDSKRHLVIAKEVARETY
jgi:sortase B